MINIGIGISWVKALYSVAANIVANFRARVAADNGIFEAAPYLDVTLDELNAIGLLDKASLITTPNAYKESKLYLVVPSDGAGDMTVVRATTATRVNENGLIETVPKNLALYSNTLSNAVWTKASATITSNALISPDGTVNASKIVEDTTTNLHRAGQGAIAVTSGQIYTFSFYAKAGERNELELQRINTSGTVFNPISVTTADLTLGTLSVGSNVTSSSINSVGNGWYKISLSLTAIATGSGGLNIGMQKDGSVYYLGDGTSGVYVYGFQAEQGSTVTSYFPTTNRLNIPRIDYTSGQGAILVEPQRTNLALYSEQFDNAAWTKTATTISANTTTSPDGTTNADKLVEETTTNVHRIIEFAGGSGVNTYSYSIFAKNFSGNRYLQLWVGNTINGAIYSRFDLQNGTVTQDTTLSGTGYSVGVSSIQNFGNGWYRCTIVGTKTNTIGTNTISVRLSQISTGIESDIYLGDGTSGVYLWGAQLEVGSYPTSYIPTVASTVTRNADVISKTGISSLIGQTEGAVFVDINVDLSYTQNDMRIINISDGTSTNWWFIGTNVSNEIRFYYKTGATTYVSQLVTLTSGRHKLAFAYKSNDYVAYVDGTQIYSLNSLIVGATSQIDLGNNFGGSVSKQFINSAILFPTRLTNAELILLTGDSFDTYNEMAEALNYTIQ
jgi:hypothetical protein